MYPQMKGQQAHGGEMGMREPMKTCLLDTKVVLHKVHEIVINRIKNRHMGFKRLRAEG